MKKDEQEPDAMGGIAIIVWATIFLAFIILVPSREGSSSRGKFYFAGMAIAGIAWGIGQIQVARLKQRKLDAAAKKQHEQKDA